MELLNYKKQLDCHVESLVKLFPRKDEELELFGHLSFLILKISEDF